jgi:hypothetical protein
MTRRPGSTTPMQFSSSNATLPWIPSLKAPRPERKVVHLGVDLLFSRYPIRGFPCDLAVTGATAAALPELVPAPFDGGGSGWG